MVLSGSQNLKHQRIKLSPYKTTFPPFFSVCTTICCYGRDAALHNIRLCAVRQQGQCFDVQFALQMNFKGFKRLTFTQTVNLQRFKLDPLSYYGHFLPYLVMVMCIFVTFGHIFFPLKFKGLFGLTFELQRKNKTKLPETFESHSQGSKKGVHVTELWV